MINNCGHCYNYIGCNRNADFYIFYANVKGD